MGDDQITRRDFSLRAATAVLGGVTITIAGCGDSGSTPSGPTGSTSTPPPASGGGVNGAVSSNHGHVATITAAELASGDALTLQIEGSAGHPHSVELSAAELESIDNGARVVKQSTVLVPNDRLYGNTAAHGHQVTFY